MKKPFFLLLIVFLVINAGMVSAFQDSIPCSDNLNNGLIAHYPFNTNANDESGNGIHGILSGTKNTVNRFGESNQALYFDGTNDICEFSDGEFDIGNYFSLNFWLKTSYWATDIRIFHKNNPPPNRSYFLSLNYSSSGKLTFWYSTDGSCQNHFTSSQIYNTGEWVLVSLQIDNVNGRISIFKNSVLDQSITYDPPIFNNNNVLSIGNTNENTYLVKGILDDIRIYDRLLTTCELEAIFYEGCPTDLSLSLENETIQTDTTMVARNQIELDNVTVLSPFELTLKSSNILISGECEIKPGAKITVSKKGHCFQ